MGMKFETSEEEEIVAEINITPLTDVFLVLLIIFMISSSVALESGLQVKLPTSKSSAVTQTKSGKPVNVTVTSEGKITVDEEDATDATLEQQLRTALSRTDDRVVVIRGDASIYLGNAVKIMDAARSAGAEKIALATQPPK